MSYKEAISNFKELLNKQTQFFADQIAEFEKIKDNVPEVNRLVFSAHLINMKFNLQVCEIISILFGLFEVSLGEAMTKGDFESINKKLAKYEDFQKLFSQVLEEYKISRKNLQDRFK